ncbi:hypothetical protein JM84_0973 [Dokdonia sp. Hel_I_63]|uniref:hypothetical protein n=1 Tax=unclassified Dokdonia TaxID=2615033 RepID=UPI00020A74C2|nr:MULTISPECIES: hypothetical protein [unclassified Dokdonia]AEE18682.1 hypothetical protein Krodi_0698 [Dokdonia sp. 4H-3-7-5]TVZ22089.1 hypothetical protein JM84_0973 [Dokdonia sp. Hel_I_63]
MEDVPDNIIPVEEADSLYRTYGQNRAPFIEGGVNKLYEDLDKPYEATRFVTADYEKMKAYMAFIEKESKEAGVTPKGLRIYFGATKPAKGNPGRETVFLNPVAAFKGIDGDISYAIHTDVDGNKEPITVGDVIDGKIPKPSDSKLSNGVIQSLAGDDVIWPPPPIQNDPNDYH